jgi:potassium efflux system protein
LQFFFLSIQTFEKGKWNDSLGRVFFIGSMILLAAGMLRASRGLKRWQKEQTIERRPLICVSMRWLAIATATTPLLVCLMSAMGYHYGAEQLGLRLIVSVILALLVAVLTGFASHLLLVTQFRIKLRQLSNDNKDELEEAIDISAISSQVNRLLSVTAIVGLIIIGWAVWGNVIPANNFLDHVQLWKGPLDSAGETTWVTLRSLFTSLGVIALTFVLSRNLPGLLEITILERLPLDRGGRYAISFVCRYVVGIVGILLTCQLLGFSWKSLQWLAAGLTVGLGFGLQEIFANLVSGIIILIERPVRVGDFVTVNGTSGTVIRMQLRATTIEDIDHRELIVPNKRFITEDVMNWTLTDAKSRVIFPVGVAYGSDTQLVEKKLLEVARRHPSVVESPAPVVVFSKFGDSSLNFELRIHIPNRDVFQRVQHEVNMEIDRVFRECNIEIAFPQQDLHIRSGVIPFTESNANNRSDDGTNFASRPDGQNEDQDADQRAA